MGSESIVYKSKRIVKTNIWNIREDPIYEQAILLLWTAEDGNRYIKVYNVNNVNSYDDIYGYGGKVPNYIVIIGEVDNPVLKICETTIEALANLTQNIMFKVQDDIGYIKCSDDLADEIMEFTTTWKTLNTLKPEIPFKELQPKKPKEPVRYDLVPIFRKDFMKHKKPGTATPIEDWITNSDIFMVANFKVKDPQIYLLWVQTRELIKEEIGKSISQADFKLSLDIPDDKPIKEYDAIRKGEQKGSFGLEVDLSDIIYNLLEMQLH